MKCTRIGEKRCNCSCFEIDQEMDAILFIIDIVYGGGLNSHFITIFTISFLFWFSFFPCYSNPRLYGSLRDVR